MACANARSSWSLRVVAGQVEQRAMHPRDRDAFVVGGVLGIEGPGGVNADPREALPAARRGHVDADLVGLEQPPMGRRRAVAEDRARPAGQDRRQPPRLDPQPAITDRVHAPMHAVQAPGRGAGWPVLAKHAFAFPGRPLSLPARE
jgi:hypothetical protein